MTRIPAGACPQCKGKGGGIYHNWKMVCLKCGGSGLRHPPTQQPVKEKWVYLTRISSIWWVNLAFNYRTLVVGVEKWRLVLNISRRVK